MASKGRNLAKLIVDTSGRQQDQVFTGDYIKVPVGTTAERPSGPSAGYVRFNTTTATLEQHDGTNWTSMAKPPIISTVSYSGSATAVDPAGGETITISGTNFSTGVNVLFGTTYATSVTRTNSTSLSVTVPALSAADYDITVVNNDGMQAILTDGLSVNGTPAFTTASGTLGNINNDVAITKITIIASEDDSGDISYTVTTGSLPTGLSIDSSSDSAGTISGTPTGYTSQTTVNFTITATDDENQTTTRNFSLTVLVSFYEYTIDQSLRFDLSSEAYLSRSMASTGNRKTWTWSAWVKISTLQSGISYPTFFDFASSSSSSTRTKLYLDAQQRIGFQFYDGSNNYYTTALPLYRDVSAWYHIVVRCDSTQSTASDRLRLYVNGEEVSNHNEGAMPQNHDTYANLSGYTAMVGNAVNDAGYERDYGGYMAEVHHIDGLSLAATSFGETKNGVWIPKEYTGTYGTNGYYLDFSNSSTLGEDQSGNNNDFTATNLASTDIVLDSPTNNFSTLNYLDNYLATTLSEGNLKSTPPVYTDNDVYNTMGMTSGKWYFEVYVAYKGAHGNVSISDSVGDTANYGSNYSYYHFNGAIGTSGTDNDDGDALVTGDILTCCFDADNGAVYWNANAAPNTAGTAQSTGMSTDVTYRVKFKENGNPRSTTVFNFGQDSSFAGSKTRQNNADSGGIGDFYYTPPTGYLALCSENLPKDDTFELYLGEKPSEHFNTVLYTGNGSTQSITGVGFQPDFIWIKTRNVSGTNQVFDVVRGTTGSVYRRLLPQDSGAEDTAANTITSIDSDGFTVGSDGNTNGSTETMVAWCWKAGGSTTVSNTNGDITSSVSANTNAGFSIVSYTANGGTNQSVGHGLNSAPEIMIIKSRDAARNWLVYTQDIDGSNDFFNLNSASTKSDSGASAPTSSLFYVTGTDINTSGEDCIAYCWHSVPGFSKMGSYTGNGSTDGTFVYTGFKPAFVLIKNTTGDNWVIFDNKRDTYNVVNTNLRANDSSAEGDEAGAILDFVSNGFKLRGDNAAAGVGQTNKNDKVYIYIAFAEDPFKYGNAR